MAGGGLSEQVSEGAAVGLRQIHHVQIVADSGAVRCRIVLPEDLK